MPRRGRSTSSTPPRRREWLEALAPLAPAAHKPFLEPRALADLRFAERSGSRSSDGVVRRLLRQRVGLDRHRLPARGAAPGGAGRADPHADPMGFVNELAGRPQNERPFMLLVTGYPADDATVPKHAMRKKSLKEISTFLE